MIGLKIVFLGIGFQLLSNGSPKYLLIWAWVGPQSCYDRVGLISYLIVRFGGINF
jgi:hypothetical protein